MDMERMIFVTGFARGGTSWLRDILGSHPQVTRIPQELVLFRRFAQDLDRIPAELDRWARKLGASRPLLVEKSPANSPFLAAACNAFPDTKFLHVIRDPRDVFVSHKRGTASWMGGANSTVKGCMAKTRRYYEGYLKASSSGAENLMLVRYEDLHQSFAGTVDGILRFLGLPSSPEILKEVRRRTDFWRVATRNVEQRDKARRKGVVGDWVNFLEEDEARWFQDDAFWKSFMQRYGYAWKRTTLADIISALADADAHALDEDDLHQARLREDRLNLLLFHDIDDLRSQESRLSVLEAARVQAAHGLPSFFFFLPLDDPRYRSVAAGDIAQLIQRLRWIHPRAVIGLHLNAAERFFPIDAEEADDDHPDMRKAVAYLHSQIDAYERLGIRFRTATAHGYGRRKKRPNNRDSPLFARELGKRGIRLWDTDLRPRLSRRAREGVSLGDVGGALAVRNLPSAGAADCAETYLSLPEGSFVHLLMHPGNYDFLRPLTLGRRTDTEWRQQQGHDSSAVGEQRDRDRRKLAG